MSTRREWLRQRQAERDARSDEALRVDDPDRDTLANVLHDIDCGWNCPGHGLMQPVVDRRYARMADAALRMLASRLKAPGGIETGGTP